MSCGACHRSQCLILRMIPASFTVNMIEQIIGAGHDSLRPRGFRRLQRAIAERDVENSGHYETQTHPANKNASITHNSDMHISTLSAPTNEITQHIRRRGTKASNAAVPPAGLAAALAGRPRLPCCRQGAAARRQSDFVRHARMRCCRRCC